MIKLIIKRLLFGIAFGCVFLVMTSILADLTGAAALYGITESFTATALAFIAVSTGFSISTIAYEFEHLALWLQIVINIVIGFGIFFLVSFHFGWISVASPVTIIVPVVLNAIIFIAIWFGYYLLNEREAKIINTKLKERDASESTSNAKP